MPAFLGFIINASLFFIFRLSVAAILGNHHGWQHSSGNVYLAGRSFASIVANTLVGPIYPIVMTLFYYDQRIRKEGYDIERMMEIAGMNAPATLLVEEAPASLAATEESLG